MSENRQILGTALLAASQASKDMLASAEAVRSATCQEQCDAAKKAHVNATNELVNALELFKIEEFTRDAELTMLEANARRAIAIVESALRANAWKL
jgi:hypothetical protein